MPQNERVARDHVQLGGSGVLSPENVTGRSFAQVRDDRDGHDVEAQGDSQHGMPCLMDRSAMEL